MPLNILQGSSSMWVNKTTIYRQKQKRDLLSDIVNFEVGHQIQVFLNDVYYAGTVAHINVYTVYYDCCPQSL